MVKIHGKPAAYAKSEAARIHARMVLIALIAVAIGEALFIAIFFLPRSKITLGLVACALVSLGLYILFRRLDPLLERMGRERIKYWRGGQTEALVAMMLHDLEGPWHVFHGVMLQEDWDIDHIVVGPGGVFAISTKSQRGCFSLGADGKVLLNGQPTAMLAQAQGFAMELRGRLEALMGADTPYVQAILAAPFAWVAYPEKQQRVWVLHQENLRDTLENEAKQKRLDAKAIARTAESIDLLAAKSKHLWRPEDKPPVTTTPVSTKQ